MKRVRADQENLYQLVEVLDLLKIGIDAYKRGKKAAWMIVSAYLHQLLTDISKGKPLALRVMPGLDFHPIINPITDNDEFGKPLWLLNCPVNISFNKDNFNLNIFDFNKKRIQLQKWLNKTIYVQPHKEQGIPIKMKHAITEPRKKGGGVHFDLEIEGPMVLIEGMLAFAQSPKGRLSYKDYIIAIGEYIHSEISSQLMGDLGNGYLSEGNFKKAEEFYRNALRINLRTKSLQGQSEQLNRLSCVYYRFGDLKKAIKFCKKSYIIGKAIDGYDIYLINKNLLIYYINKGLADFRDKNYKKAIEANKYGLIYSIENHDIYHELLCLGNLSSLYLYAGKFKYSVAIALMILTKYSHINETDLSERKNIKQNISKAIINLAYIRKNLINFHNEVMKVVLKLNNTIRIATNQSYDLEFNEDLQILYQLLDKVPKRALRLEYASFKEDET